MGRKKALRGSTALITGGARRLGRELALALAAEGVNIALHYLTSREEAENTCAAIIKSGVKAKTFGADLTDERQYGQLVRRVESAFSARPDILINNASIFLADTLKTVGFESLREHMLVNAWVPFVLTREFSRGAEHGKIINILDSKISGFDWHHVGYILSKHVLHVLTEMTALALAPRITVNAIAPGLVLAPAGRDEQYLEKLAAKVPLGRHGDAQDVVDAALYLLKSDFLTGQVIYVDGGRHLTRA
ncbi:MAG: SDR family oxidoreductase [Nitrospiraceae bacterium]|nr:SDR family oxidoreductase [Nitrospiraceae bacterium]